MEKKRKRKRLIETWVCFPWNRILLYTLLHSLLFSLTVSWTCPQVKRYKFNWSFLFFLYAYREIHIILYPSLPNSCWSLEMSFKYNWLNMAFMPLEAGGGLCEMAVASEWIHSWSERSSSKETLCICVSKQDTFPTLMFSPCLCFLIPHFISCSSQSPGMQSLEGN